MITSKDDFDSCNKFNLRAQFGLHINFRGKNIKPAYNCVTVGLYTVHWCNYGYLHDQIVLTVECLLLWVFVECRMYSQKRLCRFTR